MTMTSDDVVAVLGPADKMFVAEIIATGATQAELARHSHGRAMTRL